MMNLLRNMMFVALTGMLLLSCGKSDKTNNQITSTVASSQELAVNLKKVSLDIEGMTCEIGCARTIQSKLSKTEGVLSANVNFDEKKGVVEYDANIIDESKIVAVVQGIANGDLYKVAGTKSIKNSSKQ